jgi:DNA-binding response OmpR family regulator
MNVLFLDDDPYIRELIDFMLAPEGFKVTQCSSVSEAINVLEDKSFDVCITDIVMPEEDGTSLIKHIKQNEFDIPVLAITAGIENAQDDYVHYAEMFADLVLKKPVKKEVLLKSLKKLTS